MLNYWKDKGKDMDRDITQMNPAVDIYKLIERNLPFTEICRYLI